jgi:hypothetical protein
MMRSPTAAWRGAGNWLESARNSQRKTQASPIYDTVAAVNRLRIVN